MANTIVLTPSISADNETLTATDGTTYSNPVRSACGVFVKIYKVDYRGSEEPLSTSSSDPETDSVFTTDYTLDGHFRFKYVAVPDYVGGTTYSIYQASFDPSTNKVYRSKVNGNVGQLLTDIAYWEEISDPVTLANNKGTATESTNIDSLVANKIFNNLTIVKRNQSAIDASVEQDLDAERNKDVDKFRLLDIFVEGLSAADTYQEYTKGERIARRAEAL
jgi:hypothetical protein